MQDIIKYQKYQHLQRSHNIHVYACPTPNIYVYILPIHVHAQYLPSIPKYVKHLNYHLHGGQF
jgi:hypothetical protein